MAAVKPYTVVIPACNAADTIEAAIESVRQQTEPPESMIVVDDGSTDDTAAVVSALDAPVELIRQPNAGPGAATTMGIHHVRTPLLAMLDADDLWLPAKSSRQLTELAADPGLAAVFCRHETFDDAVHPHRNGQIMDSWGRCSIMVRTRIARQVGDVRDVPGRAGEMIDWLARMREQGHRMRMLPDVLVKRRIRPHSLGNARSGARNAAYLRVVREAIRRRRGSS